MACYCRIYEGSTSADLAALSIRCPRIFVSPVDSGAISQRPVWSGTGRTSREGEQSNSNFKLKWTAGAI